MTPAEGAIRIVVLPDGALEALALRSVLEAGGGSTDLRFVATPRQLFDMLGAGGATPQLLVLCGHGRDGALFIGALGDGLGGEMLSDGFLPPESFRGRISMRGTTVLCTACNSGMAALASHFIAGGVSAFVGPQDEPDGEDMLLAAHVFLHGIIHRGLSARAATDAAMKAVEGRMALILHQVQLKTDVVHAAQP